MSKSQLITVPFLSVRCLLLIKCHGVIITAVALSGVPAVSVLFFLVLAVMEGETAKQTFPVSLRPREEKQESEADNNIDIDYYRTN